MREEEDKTISNDNVKVAKLVRTGPFINPKSLPVETNHSSPYINILK
jgi:hypothetical protein